MDLNVRNLLASTYKSVLIAAGLVDPGEPKIVPLLDFEDSMESREQEEVVEGEGSIEEIVAREGESDYIAFKLPNMLTLSIKQSIEVFSFLRNQVKDDTPLAEWLDSTLKLLSKGENE